MSLTRAGEALMPIYANRVRLYSFKGSAATGDSGGLTNNLWNLETLAGKNSTKVADLHGNYIDCVDHWPEYGTLKITVQGVTKHDLTDWTLAVHTATADCTITFNDSIGDEDNVMFEF
uniref:Uncharacterized protein n=1 Tax=viral metagenome TaxID=1070528 RepID=A0A6H1ZJ28_9ZZZZ